jgi:hypothetical protein
MSFSKLQLMQSHLGITLAIGSGNEETTALTGFVVPHIWQSFNTSLFTKVHPLHSQPEISLELGALAILTEGFLVSHNSH